MNKELVIRFAGIEDINTIGFLAQQIWPTAYGSIIKEEQINYMLKLFYSPMALTEQILDQKHSFVFAEQDEEPVGFASFSLIESVKPANDKAVVAGDRPAMENLQVADAGNNKTEATGYDQQEQYVYKLHKLYVHPITQGKGVGKALIDFIISEIRTRQATLADDLTPHLENEPRRGLQSGHPDHSQTRATPELQSGHAEHFKRGASPEYQSAINTRNISPKVCLRLGVNRLNPALKFYERLGFAIIKEEKTEIGNGFVMDDYIMELKLL